MSFNGAMPIYGAHYVENPAKKFVDRVARAIQYDRDLYNAYRSGAFFEGKSLENAIAASLKFKPTAAAVRQAKAAALKAGHARGSTEFEQAVNQAFTSTGATRAKAASKPLSPAFRMALAQAMGKGQGYSKAVARNRGRYLEVYGKASGKDMAQVGDELKLKGFRVGKSTKGKSWKGELKTATGADAYWKHYNDVRRPGQSSLNQARAAELAQRRQENKDWAQDESARKAFREKWHTQNKADFAARPPTKGLEAEGLARLLAGRMADVDMSRYYRLLRSGKGEALAFSARNSSSEGPKRGTNKGKKAGKAQAAVGPKREYMHITTGVKRHLTDKAAAQPFNKNYKLLPMAANPFYGMSEAEFGDLAMSNPSGIGFLDRVESSVESVPVIGPMIAPILAPAALGAAAAAVHIILVPRLQAYLPEWAQPYSYSIGGGAVGIAGGLVAANAQDSTVRLAASLIGGAAVAVGLGIDAFRMYNRSGDTGDLALSGIEDMGDTGDVGAMALSGVGERAAFGDGGAYQIQNLGFAGDHSALHAQYADACMADAYFSGPDLDGVEGEAVLAGASAYMGAFGAAPIRAAGQRRPQSRHAGLRGHRWAWLIKMVGFEKFQQITALPPAQRVSVIRNLREQAMASVQRLIDESKAAQLASQPVTAPATLSQSGATAGYDMSGYGATMFSGGSY